MPAESVLPFPPLVEVTCTLLFFIPADVPWTFTLKLQELLAARVAPLRLIVPDPAVAVMVPPPHEPVSPLGVATTRPAGRLSVNATPVSAVVSGLVIVKVRLVLPPTAMADAPNAFTMVSEVTTVMLALAKLPAPPSLEPTWLLVLFFTPADVPWTFTLKLQEPLAATVPPVMLTRPDPATFRAWALPPHVLVSPLGVATTRPAGRASLTPTPV